MGRITQLPVIAVNATNNDGTGGQPFFAGAMISLWISVPNRPFRIIGAYVICQTGTNFNGATTYTDGTIKIAVQVVTSIGLTPFAEGIMKFQYNNVTRPPTGLSPFISGYVSLSGYLPEGIGFAQLRFPLPDTMNFVLYGSGLNPSNHVPPWAALIVEEL